MKPAAPVTPIVGGRFMLRSSLLLFMVMPLPSGAGERADGPPARSRSARRRRGSPARARCPDRPGPTTRRRGRARRTGPAWRDADRVDRLGDAGARDLGRDHVLLAERGEHRLQVAEELAPDVRGGLLQLGRVRVDVLRQVDEVALGGRRVHHVGGLDDARERHPPVGDVERVVRADAVRARARPGRRCPGSAGGRARARARARAPACAAGWGAAAWPPRCRAGRNPASSTTPMARWSEHGTKRTGVEVRTWPPCARMRSASRSTIAW